MSEAFSADRWIGRQRAWSSPFGSEGALRERRFGSEFAAMEAARAEVAGPGRRVSQCRYSRVGEEGMLCFLLGV